MKNIHLLETKKLQYLNNILLDCLKDYLAGVEVKTG